MDFNGVRSDTLRERPVYVIQGKWKPELRQRWQAQPPANATVYFSGVDPRVGALTKIAFAEPYADAR